MLISYDFGISLEEYAIRGRSNHFPLFDECPNCNCIAHGNLHRNGYYWRGMRRGILVYDQNEQEWRVWICQRRYWVQQGYTFELRIQHRYYPAYLEKDLDWFVTLNEDVKLILHTQEVYKVRISMEDYMPVDAPF